MAVTLPTTHNPAVIAALVVLMLMIFGLDYVFGKFVFFLFKK